MNKVLILNWVDLKRLTWVLFFFRKHWWWNQRSFQMCACYFYFFIFSLTQLLSQSASARGRAEPGLLWMWRMGRLSRTFIRGIPAGGSWSGWEAPRIRRVAWKREDRRRGGVAERHGGGGGGGALFWERFGPPRSHIPSCARHIRHRGSGPGASWWLALARGSFVWSLLSGCARAPRSTPSYSWWSGNGNTRRRELNPSIFEAGTRRLVDPRGCELTGGHTCGQVQGVLFSKEAVRMHALLFGVSVRSGETSPPREEETGSPARGQIWL